MRNLLVLLLAGFAVAQEPAPNSQKTSQETSQPASRAPFQNVGSMSQLMIDIIYPSSDAIFYVERNAPKTQSDWNALQNQALMLAESGNLLMMPGRARDQGDWMKDARLVVEAGNAAFKAARAKDLDAVVALNEQLYSACVTCHEQYRPDYRRRREAQQKANEKADQEKALKEKTTEKK
jgi:hypothetical protein